MKRYYFYFGLFSVTAATIMLQLIQTRILSVVAWYYLAFFVISSAMFGLTAGAVWVYLRGDRFSQETLSFDLTRYTIAFAVSTTVALALQMTLLPIYHPSATTFVIWVELIVCLFIPFFFSGVVVSLALTRSPYPIGRVYGVDLLGAAVGCFGVLLLLDRTDGPSAVLWTSTLIAFGATLFSKSDVGRAPVGRSGGTFRFAGLWLALLAALATVNTLDDKRLGLYPVYAKGVLQIGSVPWFEKWNSFSRVVAEHPNAAAPPQMWGPSPTFEPDDWRIDQSSLTIDGDAGTTAYGIFGDISKAGFLEYDVTNLAYLLPERHSAAIIGVGGARDVISALVLGVDRVVGVEINPYFIDLLSREPEFRRFVGLDQLQNVTLHVDEARSWFARSSAKFDVIQMSLIDTWAATGAGAFTLSENGLYTVEAWQIFLRRLNDGGVFTVSRWYSSDHVNEAGRLISLAVASLLELGLADPREHIFLAGSGRIATLIVSVTGFSEFDLQTLRHVAQRLKYNILIAPGRSSASDTLDAILSAKSMSELNSYTSTFFLDLTPPTDERPFFFNQLPLHNGLKLISVALLSGNLSKIQQGNWFATANLAMLFFISVIAVICVIIIPLKNALDDVGRRVAVGGTAYFALIGMGFMFAEIGSLQRFSVFLGHPIYSLSIVLFSLILATGIGSLLSERYAIMTRRRFGLWAVASSVYVASQAFWVPEVLSGLDGSDLILRGIVVVAVISPMGVLMGYGFPTGMRLVSEVDRRPTPWLWGINGASGVLAATTAVGCSIAYGIGTTLVLGAACYLLLIPAAWTIGFPQRPASN